MTIEQVKETFIQNNNRLTQNRITMSEIFVENSEKHFTKDQIIQELEKRGEKNIATVYNNLSLLEELNIIASYNLNGTKYYELMERIHGHFVCENCNKIFNVDLPGLSCLGIEIFNKYGACVTSNSIEFKGKCCRCSND